MKYLKMLGSVWHQLYVKPEGGRKKHWALKMRIKFGPGFEAMCNPAAQAMLLNKEQTELNIILGLCVGHDTLFIKNSDAPITVLTVKDRVTGHNPLAAVYASHYFESKAATLICPYDQGSSFVDLVPV